MLKPLLRYLRNIANRLVEPVDVPVAVHAKPEDASYRIYTTEFDEVVSGAALLARADAAVDDGAAEMNPYVNVDHKAFAHLVKTLRANCQTLSSDLQETLSPKDRNDTVVTLLFDHSGSLRGIRALVIAEVAEALADALTSAGIATDVLGFTTVRWKGGRTREKWSSDGRPPLPGRLNDILHIVYLDGFDGPRAGPHRFPAMRRDRMFKENVDGEALEWAHARLTKNSRARKVLIAFSDGAPVDDSTLNDNWQTILTDHLQHVVTQIASSNDVTLGAIGIEHAVQHYYPKSTTAKNLSAMATIAPEFVKLMVTDAHR